jgi:hypothetical protein
MTAQLDPRQRLSQLMAEQATLQQQFDAAANRGDSVEAGRFSNRKKTITADILRARIEVKEQERQTVIDAQKGGEARIPDLFEEAKRTEFAYLAAKETHEQSLRELQGANSLVGVHQDQANRLGWEIDQLRKQLAAAIRAEVSA